LGDPKHASMFKVLQAHEEREPQAVLKTQSKRAQKRLNRQKDRKEKADRLEVCASRDFHAPFFAPAKQMA
jgi:hypothetical protein